MRKSAERWPLQDLHESLGAVWTEDRGVRVPAHYGNPEGERAALSEAAGLWDGSAADRFELLGSDRHRFLNGMVTADVAALPAGANCYGLFTNVKGRVLADATILALGDRLWVRVPPSRGAEVREHLSKFIITDRVEILPLGDRVPIEIVGPDSRRLVEQWTNETAPGPGEHRQTEILGSEVRLAHAARRGADAYVVWVSASQARDLAAALLDEQNGLRPVGFEAVDRLRIERGIPRFGAEIGPDTFPQEAGVDEAVSYEKGCYLGQEVVARIHFRGGIKRHLVALDLPPGPLPVVGCTISLEDREAGKLSSVAARWGTDGGVGLAVLANRAAEPGTLLQLAGELEARVLDPPTVV